MGSGVLAYVTLQGFPWVMDVWAVPDVAVWRWQVAGCQMEGVGGVRLCCCPPYLQPGYTGGCIAMRQRDMSGNAVVH